MAFKTTTSPAATAYSQAIIELATAQNLAEPVGQELRDLMQLVDSLPLVGMLFRDPTIGNAERGRFIQTSFEGRLSPLVYNVLGVLSKHGRLRLLPEIVVTYEHLLARQLGRVDVEVTTAEAIDSAMVEEIQQKVSTALKKTAIIRQRVDESVIGGMVLRVEDKLIDASVRAQLDAMKKQLIAAAPR